VSTPTPFIRDTFFEEVSFSLEGNQGHRRKWVGHTVNVSVLESNHKAVHKELDVLTHETRVHTKQSDGGIASCACVLLNTTRQGHPA
jgi:hypothetical protein